MLDLTQVLNTVIVGAFTVATTVILAMIQARMKDRAAAETLSNAVKNSLGAIQNALIDQVNTAKPHVKALGLPDHIAVGVQYVLDHAGTEAERFGITPEAIADKIEAQLGLAQRAKEIAAAAPAPIINVQAEGKPPVRLVAVTPES